MKKIFLIAAACWSLLQSACLTSMHPLVTYKNAVTENRVTGNWTGKETDFKVEKMTDSWIYKEMTKSINISSPSQILAGKDKEDSVLVSKAYSISYEKNNVRYYMMGTFTNIGDELFMELLPLTIDDPGHEDNNKFEYTHYYLQTFSIAKVIFPTAGKMTLQFLDGDYIRKQIKENRLRIKYEQDKLFDSFVITASTEDLHQFLLKYSHDQQLFNPENSISLTKKG